MPMKRNPLAKKTLPGGAETFNLLFTSPKPPCKPAALPSAYESDLILRVVALIACELASGEGVEVEIQFWCPRKRYRLALSWSNQLPRGSGGALQKSSGVVAPDSPPDSRIKQCGNDRRRRPGRAGGGAALGAGRRVLHPTGRAAPQRSRTSRADEPGVGLRNLSQRERRGEATARRLSGAGPSCSIPYHLPLRCSSAALSARPAACAPGAAGPGYVYPYR